MVVSASKIVELEQEAAAVEIVRGSNEPGSEASKTLTLTRNSDGDYLEGSEDTVIWTGDEGGLRYTEDQ
jgi:hypothetical protein